MTQRRMTGSREYRRPPRGDWWIRQTATAGAWSRCPQAPPEGVRSPMKHHMFTQTEGGLWLPPPARWHRYQGKERLIHPDAIRHAVDRAAVSAWEHIPAVFRPFIAARLDRLWLKAGPTPADGRCWDRGSSWRSPTRAACPNGIRSCATPWAISWPTPSWSSSPPSRRERTGARAPCHPCGRRQRPHSGTSACRRGRGTRGGRTGGHQRHGEGDPRRLGYP